MSAIQFANLLIASILNPLLYVLFAAAMVVFMYGVVEFLWNLTQEGKASSEGKKHMLWGLIGLLIMLTAASIIGLVVNSVEPGSWPPTSGSTPSSSNLTPGT